MNELEKLKEIERVRGASELTPLEWAVWVLGNIGNVPKAEQAAADLARLKQEAETKPVGSYPALEKLISRCNEMDLQEQEQVFHDQFMADNARRDFVRLANELKRLQVIERAAQGLGLAVYNLLVDLSKRDVVFDIGVEHETEIRQAYTDLKEAGDK